MAPAWWLRGESCSCASMRAPVRQLVLLLGLLVLAAAPRSASGQIINLNGLEV